LAYLQTASDEYGPPVAVDVCLVEGNGL